MKIHFTTALALAAGLMSAAAAPVPDSIDAHVLAAQAAAGLDFAGTLEVLCIQPADGSDPSAAARAANAGKPRAIPPRESWYAEPAKVFDNVYFVGTKEHNSWAIKTSAGIILIDTMFNYAAEAEINTDPQVRAAYFIVEPNQEQLIEIGRLVDQGQLKTFVKGVVPFSDASLAYTGAVRDKRTAGKFVVDIELRCGGGCDMPDRDTVRLRQ